MELAERNYKIRNTLGACGSIWLTELTQEAKQKVYGERYK